jgi:hypothetical protein
LIKTCFPASYCCFEIVEARAIRSPYQYCEMMLAVLAMHMAFSVCTDRQIATLRPPSWQIANVAAVLKAC